MKKEFNFLDKAKIALIFSSICILGAIFVWFSKGNTKYGVDFLGGSEIVVAVKGDISSDQIRKQLEKNGIDEPVVQSFESTPGTFVIRLAGTKEAGEEFKNKIKSIISELGETSIESFSFVGPVIGQELRDGAVISIILGLIVLNGLLSMAEIALVSVRKSRLETSAKKGNKWIKMLLDEYDDLKFIKDDGTFDSFWNIYNSTFHENFDTLQKAVNYFKH